MKNFVNLFIFSLLFGLSAFVADAKFIVEERDAALNRTIFAPANSKPRKIEQKSDVSVDYKKSLSQKFFDDVPDMLLVDVEEAGTSVTLQTGQFIAVRLEEQNGTSWTFEKHFPSLVFVKKEKRNGLVILLYQAVEFGEAKLTFDLMKDGRALVSRILNVKVI